MNPKVLVVEDDGFESELMVEAIASVSDADIVVKPDGRAALDYLRDHGPDTHAAPAVVFLDLGLPRVGGLELLREFQGTADARRVPIVVFTDSLAPADRYLSYHLGANAFVVKPSSPEQMRAAVRAAAAFWLRSNVRPPLR